MNYTDEQIERQARWLAAAYWRGKLEGGVVADSLEAMIRRAVEDNFRVWLPAARRCLSAL